MMTGRELVIRTIRFESPERLPFDFPPEYGSDFAWTEMTPSPDYRPSRGVDEWGALWKNIGVCNLGEVERFPLVNWSDFHKLKIPDIHDPARWRNLDSARGSPFMRECTLSAGWKIPGWISMTHLRSFAGLSISWWR